MARNLFSTNLTDPFGDFPNDPGMTISTSELKPVFDALPAEDQQMAIDAVKMFDPRGGEGVYQSLAARLGVQLSVAYGLMVLLHPEA